MEDIFSRIGEIKSKGKKKPNTYSRITKDEQRNRTTHIATAPANKPIDQIALADYNVTTIPIGRVTEEQEREEFKDSVQNMLRQLDEMTAERDMYRARAKQAEGYIDHLLRPLQHASESHVPPLALAQKTTTEFEGVHDTAKAVKEWVQSIKKKAKKIINDVFEVAIEIQVARIKMLQVQKEYAKI